MLRKFLNYLNNETDGYYDNVYFTLVKEALIESLNVLKINKFTIENAKKVHQYISENLI